MGGALGVSSAAVGYLPVIMPFPTPPLGPYALALLVLLLMLKSRCLLCACALLVELICVLLDSGAGLRWVIGCVGRCVGGVR